MKILRHLALFLALLVAGAGAAHAAGDFPRPLESFADAGIASLGAKLLHRAKAEPFNVFASALFLCAIVHTFLTLKFRAISHRCQHQFEAHSNPDPSKTDFELRDRLQFRAQMFHFAGEVEAVFGIWLVPLFAAIVVFKGWDAMVHYVSDTSFAEAVFVTVIMAMAANKGTSQMPKTASTSPAK